MVLDPESSRSLTDPPLGRARAPPEPSCLERGFHRPLGWPALCSLRIPSRWLPVDILGAMPPLESCRAQATGDPRAHASPKREGKSDSLLACGYLQHADHITGNSCEASERADNPWALWAVRPDVILSHGAPRPRPITKQGLVLGEALGKHLPLPAPSSLRASFPHLRARCILCQWFSISQLEALERSTELRVQSPVCSSLCTGPGFPHLRTGAVVLLDFPPLALAL